MKKPLLIFAQLLLLCASTAYAEEGLYLHIQTGNGWRVLNLDKVDRLTFSGANMIASDASNTPVETFKRSDLVEMYVGESSGVRSVMADGPDATFAFQNGNAKMLSDGKFEVYAADGTLLVSINAKKGENIDLSAIAQKIVILKSGSFTTKVSLR